MWPAIVIPLIALGLLAWLNWYPITYRFRAYRLRRKFRRQIDRVIAELLRHGR